MKALRLKALQHAPTSLQKGNGNLKIGKKVYRLIYIIEKKCNGNHGIAIVNKKGNGNYGIAIVNKKENKY